jgi:hypothetical protein
MTEREKAFGNEIIFASNRLQYLSTPTKLRISSQFVDRGIMSVNEARAMWNMPPVEGGDVRHIRKEYMNTDNLDKEDDDDADDEGTGVSGDDADDGVRRGGDSEAD